jgi:hypothetical protein
MARRIQPVPAFGASARARADARASASAPGPARNHVETVVGLGYRFVR